MEQKQDVIIALITKSSNIIKASYTRSTKVLRISFAGGKTYDYHDVSEYHGEAFCTAPLDGSFGKHFSRAIKDRYQAINVETSASVEPIKTPFSDKLFTQ